MQSRHVLSQYEMQALALQRQLDELEEASEPNPKP